MKNNRIAIAFAAAILIPLIIAIQNLPAGAGGSQARSGNCKLNPYTTGFAHAYSNSNRDGNTKANSDAASYSDSAPTSDSSATPDAAVTTSACPTALVTIALRFSSSTSRSL